MTGRLKFKSPYYHGALEHLLSMISCAPRHFDGWYQIRGELMKLYGILLGLLAACAGWDQARADDERWTKIYSITVPRTNSPSKISLSDFRDTTPYLRGLRLSIKEGNAIVRTLIVQYQNGQRDYVYDLALTKDQAATATAKLPSGEPRSRCPKASCSFSQAPTGTAYL
jgi:hypothetical protein